MTDAVHGDADARFDKVAEALAEELSSGAEVGAAIAIDIDGESVLDIWGGYADALSASPAAEGFPAKALPWAKPDTIITRLVEHEDRDEPGRADSCRARPR